MGRVKLIFGVSVLIILSLVFWLRQGPAPDNSARQSSPVKVDVSNIISQAVAKPGTKKIKSAGESSPVIKKERNVPWLVSPEDENKPLVLRVPPPPEAQNYKRKKGPIDQSCYLLYADSLKLKKASRDKIILHYKKITYYLDSFYIVYSENDLNYLYWGLAETFKALGERELEYKAFMLHHSFFKKVNLKSHASSDLWEKASDCFHNGEYHWTKRYFKALREQYPKENKYTELMESRLITCLEMTEGVKAALPDLKVYIEKYSSQNKMMLARYQLAGYYKKLNRYDESIKCLREIGKDFPKDWPEIYWSIGAMQMNSGKKNYPKAIKTFRYLIKHYPKDHGVKSAKNYIRLMRKEIGIDVDLE